VNDCNYCATSHAYAAEQAGASEPLRQACTMLRFDGLPEHERVALEFARKAAGDMASIQQEDVDRLRKHFTAPQVVELAAVIGSFMMYNTFVTVLGLELEPQHGKGVLPG
jgi:alkylhydroperoxidase family enzyme